MSALTRAARARLSWSQSSLGIYFSSFRVRRQVNRLPFWDWPVIGEITVPAGYDRTTVSLQHTRFDDYMAGYYSEGGEWEYGHNYVVTEVDITGAETRIDPALVTAKAVTVPDPGTTWWTCNQLPLLNCPIEIPELTDSTTEPGIISRRYVGRDKFVNLGPSETPGRQLTTTAEFFGQVGPDELRCLRLAMKSRLQFAMLRPLGDRVVGNPYVAGFSDARVGRQSVRIGINETVEDAVADYNLPACCVLDGTNDYLTTPDGNHLDFGTGAFSVVIAGIFPATSGAVHISKGNAGSGTSWGIRNTSGTQVSLTINGTNVVTASSTVLADGDVHVLEARATQNAQELILDGVQIGTGSATYTTVNNSVALVAGANNAGGSSYSALGLQSYAVYPVNTDARSAAVAAYLLGYPAARLPPGAVLFVDHRDDRCWNGISTTRTDLSSWANRVTAVGGPKTRGITWPIRRYESV